jgi:hypothetical protein
MKDLIIDEELKTVEIYFKRKQWNEANILCAQLREQYPSRPEGFIRGATALRMIGKIDEGIPLLDESIKLHPKAINNKIEKALSLMELLKWKDADTIWNELRKSHPNNIIGFIQGGIALRNLGEIDKAIKLWLNIDTRISRGLILDVIEKINDMKLYKKSWDFLTLEVFDFNLPTLLSQKVQTFFVFNKLLFDKYIKILKNYQNLDYFSKIALGLVDTPDVKYLTKIFLTQDLNIITRVASSSSFHKKNITVVKNNLLHDNLSDVLIKRAYLNIFKENDFKKLKEKKLKIAVCVSGQLRGYRKAFETWNKFDFNKHDTDYFCCVWNKLGRKKIVKQHIHRVFDKHFSQAFLKELTSKNEEEMHKLFTNLYTYFENTDIINEMEIKEFYSAKKVKVINEENYRDKTDMHNMHFMIQKCYELIENPKEYDIIIRIRPDKLINNFNIAWKDIFYNLNDKKIFTDVAPIVNTGVGLFIGDQVAIANPEVMKIYATTFEKVLYQKGVFSEKNYNYFRPHISLCASLLEQNIFGSSLPDEVKFGQPIDPERISSKKLLEIIEKDLKDYPEKKALFIEAIKKDENEKPNN